MDVLTAITTIYTLARDIITWVENQAEKEVVIHQISGTIAQIQHILLPLQEAGQAIGVQPQTVGAIKSIASVLNRTQDHLRVWKYQRSRRIVATLSPSSVINQLKEDERQLSQQLVLLLTSIAVINFVERERRSSFMPAPAVVSSKQAFTESMFLNSINNREVKEFWSGYVGAQVCLRWTLPSSHKAKYFFQLPYISSDDFCRRLGSWMGVTLNVPTCKRLLLRLDEFSIGGVTPTALESMVGSGSLRAAVQIYTTGECPSAILIEGP
jgi:hypothetical protein